MVRELVQSIWWFLALGLILIMLYLSLTRVIIQPIIAHEHETQVSLRVTPTWSDGKGPPFHASLAYPT